MPRRRLTPPVAPVVLVGSKLLRLVYFDEAGIGNIRHEPILTVGAVIVHADDLLVPIERELNRIVRKHIPQEYWPTFVFHATNLFNWGGKVFTKNNPDWPISRRLEIAAELPAIPANYDIPLTVGICDRTKFPSDQTLASNMSDREITIAAHVATFFHCAIKVEHWMRIHADDEVCMLIVEDNSDARRYIKADFVMPLMSDKEKSYFPFQHIKEDPAFQEKAPGSILQIADFWTYIAKRIVMNPIHRVYRPLFDLMRGQIWEPYSLVSWALGE